MSDCPGILTNNTTIGLHCLGCAERDHLRAQRRTQLAAAHDEIRRRGVDCATLSMGMQVLRDERDQLRAHLAVLQTDDALHRKYRYENEAELEQLRAQLAEVKAERLELVEQRVPEWLTILERFGTGVDISPSITVFAAAGTDGVAYILRSYHENYTAQKHEIRTLKAQLAQRTAALQELVSMRDNAPAILGDPLGDRAAQRHQARAVEAWREARQALADLPDGEGKP